VDRGAYKGFQIRFDAISNTYPCIDFMFCAAIKLILARDLLWPDLRPTRSHFGSVKPLKSMHGCFLIAAYVLWGMTGRGSDMEKGPNDTAWVRRRRYSSLQ